MPSATIRAVIQDTHVKPLEQVVNRTDACFSPAGTPDTAIQSMEITMTPNTRLFRTAGLITLVAACLTGPALADTVGNAGARTGDASSTAVPSDAPVAPAATATYTLTVTVSGVRSGNGRIMAGLLKADRTAGTAASAGGTMAPAVEGTTVLTFAGLAEGDYAVRLFHDENGDGEMGMNLFGIPTEGYGFSNAARARFGPPAFSEMKVEVRADATTLAVMAY
jgi:uncharacterized protein (DUF2141 family)